MHVQLDGQLAVGNPKTLTASLMTHKHLQDAIYEEACVVVQKKCKACAPHLTLLYFGRPVKKTLQNLNGTV